MAEKLWAEIDEDWKRKEERALAQRQANLIAKQQGTAPPYPSPFQSLGPAKLPSCASAEEYREWYLKHREMTHPFQPKKHTI